MAHYYHEPEPFRYSLGAFLQAARSLTFVLQSEKSVFPDFSWYEEWVERTKSDPVLQWLKNARTDFVHRQSLEPDSWVEMRCVGNSRLPLGYNEEEGPVIFKVSPFACTHYYIGAGPSWEDHPHEYRRHWGLQSLPGRELLDATADIYDRLDDLVHQAHEQLGAHTTDFTNATSFSRGGVGRNLPCMENTERYGIVRTTLKDGREVWENEPAGLHNE